MKRFADFPKEEEMRLRKLLVPQVAEMVIELYGDSLVLQDFQKNWMSGKDRLNITAKSRRIGYSFCKAIEKLIRAHVNSNYTCQFISYCQEDAKEKIKVAREVYEFIPKEYRKELKSDSKTVLEFYDKGGKTISRLLSLPCRAPRGKEGDLVLDEFAHFPDEEPIYIAALPVITGGYQLDLGTTPLGIKNLFAKIFNDNDLYPNYIRDKICWWESFRLSANLKRSVKEAPMMTTEERVKKFGTDELQLIFKSLDIESFKQEYECLFIDEATAFIPLSMIKACIPSKPEIYEYKTIEEFMRQYDRVEHGLVYLGYDVGRLKHSSELTILTKKDDNLTVRASISFQQTPFDKQQEYFRHCYLPV